MLEVGERVWNMEREFNMRAGITAEQDRLPERLMKDAAKTGPAIGKVSEVDKMMPEYYQLRGWTANGELTDDTRQRLNLPAW